VPERQHCWLPQEASALDQQPFEVRPQRTRIRRQTERPAALEQRFADQPSRRSSAAIDRTGVHARLPHFGSNVDWAKNVLARAAA
jgi:hypothetical protein